MLYASKSSRRHPENDSIFTSIPIRESPKIEAIQVQPEEIALPEPARSPNKGPSLATQGASLLPKTNYSSYEFKGFKGRITSAYADSFRATKKTGVAMTPQTTLREYMHSVAPLLPVVGQRLGELTVLTEKTLYSNFEPDAIMAARAEQLANDIKSSRILGSPVN